MLVEISEVILENVSLSLDKEVLSDISLRVKNGIHCFLGPNGAGKTMTNKLLGLLLQPTNGQIKWDEKIVNPYEDREERIERIRKIGYMSQNPTFLSTSVKDNISLPLKLRHLEREKRTKLVSEKVKQFNLDELVDRSIYKLSIGQKQKVALLRALIHDPSIIIMDEPTASLDIANIKWFESHIKDISEQDGIIIFWTTHDQFQVKRIGDTVSVFISGDIRETNTVNGLFSNTKDPEVEAYLNGKLF